MLSKKLQEKTRAFIKVIQRYVDRIWYAPLVGFLAAIDNIVIVIPTDGILISSSMLVPKRWFFLALSVAIGSMVGAVMLSSIVEYQGLPWIMEFYPGITDTKVWSVSAQFFEKYGMLLVFVVALTPIMQQPAVILAGLANTPLLELAAVIFTGRFIKYLIMAYVGSHAPRLLGKMWGVKGELEEVGVQINSK